MNSSSNTSSSVLLINLEILKINNDTKEADDWVVLLCSDWNRLRCRSEPMCQNSDGKPTESKHSESSCCPQSRIQHLPNYWTDTVLGSLNGSLTACMHVFNYNNSWCSFIPCSCTRWLETGKLDTSMSSPLETTNFSLESFNSSEMALSNGQEKKKVHIYACFCFLNK